MHGRLGETVRVPVPHCVMKAVRDKFPDLYEEYRSFEEAPDEELDEEGDQIEPLHTSAN